MPNLDKKTGFHYILRHETAFQVDLPRRVPQPPEKRFPINTALLNQVKPWNWAYIEARRLEEFLYNFSALSADMVPGDSILREYIGGSQLTYG